MEHWLIIVFCASNVNWNQCSLHCKMLNVIFFVTVIQNPDMWALYGHLYYMKKDYSQAQEYYERTLDFVTDASDTHTICLRLGSIYLEKGQVGQHLLHKLSLFSIACDARLFMSDLIYCLINQRGWISGIMLPFLIVIRQFSDMDDWRTFSICLFLIHCSMLKQSPHTCMPARVLLPVSPGSAWGLPATRWGHDCNHAQ